MTASGYTTSSQDTPSIPKKQVEDAPFNIYLQILRSEGYEEDAEISESFYTETLKAFGYDEETIYKTPFKNLVKAVEIILESTQKELANVEPQMQIPLSESMLLGEGAEKLTQEQLQKLLMRQMILHEEEKTRLMK